MKKDVTSRIFMMNTDDILLFVKISFVADILVETEPLKSCVKSSYKRLMIIIKAKIWFRRPYKAHSFSGMTL